MIFIKNILQNKFLKNVAVLASGAAVGQIIVLAATPFLTRFYSPESFGLLAFYAAILSVVSVISSLRYELAIPLAKTDEVAASVLVLSFTLVLFIAFCATVILFFLDDNIGQWFNLPEISQYLWLLPISIVLNGFYNISSYWAIRNKSFTAVAKTKITQATFMVIVQLAAYKLGSVALIIGHTAGQFVGVGNLWLLAIKKNLKLFRAVRFSEIGKVAVRYRKFPLFSTWAGLLNAVGTQAPNILFVMFFGPAAAGFFFMANRIVSSPLSLVGNAIGQTFFAEAAAAKRNGTLDKTAKRTVVKLFFIIIGPALFVAIFGSELFIYILGENWAEAGRMAQWITPMIVAQFITFPVGQLLAVKEKQLVGMVLQGVLTTLRLFSIFIGYLYFDVVITTALYSLSSLVGYLLFLYFSLTSKSLKNITHIQKENR